MISARLLVYHFFGGMATAYADLVTVPFIVLMSDSMVKLQDPDGEFQKSMRGSDVKKSPAMLAARKSS
jgi:hypothetical protein